MAIDLVARLRLEDQMSGPLAALNGKLMGMVGFAAVTAGATSAVKSFADFDTAIRKAATIAGASDAEFTAMGEAAKELGASTSLSASQVAEAMTEMAAKGYSATQVIDAMPGVIAAAEASGEDLALTSDVVATALNVWGMKASEASDVADVLAMTANKTAAGIGDMQYALKYAGAPAKALGMSLEEVSAAAGLMVNAGLDGSSAGTAMRQGLSQLVNPTKAAATAMDKYGFSAIDANGKVKSMADIVGNLQSSMEGMTEAQRVSYMKTLVGTESMSAFLTLVDAGPEKLTELQKSLENSGGSAQEAADKMKAGIGGALEQASGAIETFMINVGEALAPAVRVFADMIANMNTEGAVAKIGELGDKLTAFAEKLVATDWTPFVQAFSTAFDAVLATATFVIDHFNTIITVVKLLLGAFLALKALSFIVGVFNIVASAVTMGIRVFRALRTALTIARTAFTVLRISMLLFPGTWLIGAIVALIAIGVVLYKNWDTVKAKTAQLWAKFKETSAFRAIQSGMDKVKSAAEKVKGAFESVKDGISRAMQRARIAVTDSINSIIGQINNLISKINMIPGVNVPLIATVEYRTTGSVDNKQASVKNSGSAGTNAVNGPHALGNHGGWDEIRTDGTLRSLHAGERVLTAVENDNYKQMMQSGLPKALAKLASARPTTEKTTQQPATAPETAPLDQSALAAAFKSVMPTTLDNMHGASTAVQAPRAQLDMSFDGIVAAINGVAKRAINVMIPKDETTGKALNNIAELLSLNLSAKDSEALASTVDNSTFSDTVSNVTTTNTIANATTKTENKKVDVGGITIQATVREEADVDRLLGAMHDKLAELA